MDAAPYYAPTYFPPEYFYFATTPDPASPSTGMSPYNPPTYFPPSYFYGGPSAPISVPVVPEPQGRDQGAYAALLASLRATGVFEEVIFGAATQRGQAGADSYPLAVLTPRGWEESDDFDPALIVRRVSFSITIVVKSQDTGPRFDLLDQLSLATQNVVDRSGLDGTCLPPLTRIRAGRYGYSSHYPEQSIELEGEYSSLIDPSANVPVSS